jgi:hypothetical protein
VIGRLEAGRSGMMHERAPENHWQSAVALLLKCKLRA